MPAVNRFAQIAHTLGEASATHPLAAAILTEKLLARHAPGLERPFSLVGDALARHRAMFNASRRHGPVENYVGSRSVASTQVRLSGLDDQDPVVDSSKIPPRAERIDDEVTLGEILADPLKYNLKRNEIEEIFDVLLAQDQDVMAAFAEIDEKFAERESLRRPGYAEAAEMARIAYETFDAAKQPYDVTKQALDERQKQLDKEMGIDALSAQIRKKNSINSPEKTAMQEAVQRAATQPQVYYRDEYSGFASQVNERSDGGFKIVFTLEDARQMMDDYEDFMGCSDDFKVGFYQYAVAQGMMLRLRDAFEEKFGVKDLDDERRRLKTIRDQDEELIALRIRARELDNTIAPLKETATSLEVAANQLTDFNKDNRIQGLTTRSISNLANAIEDYRDRVYTMLSWTVQQAVNTSPTDLAEFYQLLAIVAQRYRQLYQKIAEWKTQVDAVSKTVESFLPNLRAGAQKKLHGIHQAYTIDTLMFKSMILPTEQKGRGQFYDRVQELKDLGLEHLIDILPDRLPLPPRSGVSLDEAFREGNLLRIYDLGLRTAIGFDVRGEFTATDKGIGILTHGTGTSTSTLAGVARWARSTMNDFTVKTDSGEKTDRVLSVVFFAEPHHGFGTRDPRLLPVGAVDRLTDEMFFADFEDPEIAERYLSHVIHRYTGYRKRGAKVIFGGRSTGGSEAQILRLGRKGEFTADGYINMSGIPDRFGAVDSENPIDRFPFMIYFDLMYLAQSAELSQQSSNPLVMNHLGLWFTLGLLNSADRLNDIELGPDTPPILHLSAGQDTDYAQFYPATLHLDDQRTQDWIEHHVQVAFEFKKRRYGEEHGLTHDEIRDIYVNIILGYRELLKKRYGWDDHQVDMHWAYYVQDKTTVAKFWQSDAERDPNDQSRAYHDEDAAHNLIDEKVNSPDSFSAARSIIKAFISQILGISDEEE